MKIKVLVSGTGSTLENLVMNSIKVDLVIASNEKSAHVIKKHNLTVGELEFCENDLIVLAGWVHLLKIPKDYKGTIINIHPSLLPAYGGKGMYGIHVHKAVIANKEKKSGCTVHYIDEEYDHGRIISQKEVPVYSFDTEYSLQERVKEAERELYPRIIKDLINGKIL